MNRRGFFKLLSVASAGLVLDPTRSVVANNGVYVNKKLGIAFQAPQDWHFYNVYEMKKMHNAQITRAEVFDIEDLISELEDQPLVALGKYPADVESHVQVFSPSIVIRLKLIEEKISLAEIISGSNETLSHLVTHYQSISEGMDHVCGYQAAVGKYSYLFEAEGMESTPIVGRSYIIDIDRYFYSINMYNYDPEDTEISRCFDRFVESINIL